MTTSLFVGIIILCGIFAVGEVLSKFTKYKIPTLVIAMFAFIISADSSASSRRTRWLLPAFVTSPTHGACRF